MKKQRINLEISANDKGAHSNEENQNSRCGTKVYKVNYFRKKMQYLTQKMQWISYKTILENVTENIFQ